MSNGYYLFETARWDAQQVSVFGGLVNQLATSAPPKNVLLPKVSDAYTTAETGSSGGTISFRFRPPDLSNPVSAPPVPFDTVIIPGIHIVGAQVDKMFTDSDGDTVPFSYLRSLATKPTGTIGVRTGRFTSQAFPAVAVQNPVAPNDVRDIAFHEEAVLAPDPTVDRAADIERVSVISTWRGFAALTFNRRDDDTAIQVDINVNAPNARIVVPRIMAGVRFQPERNFSDNWRTGWNDPTRIGARQGADLEGQRRAPYRPLTLPYENIGGADRDRLFDMFRRSGKTIPLVAVPVPDNLDMMVYARMLDTVLVSHLLDPERGIDYSSVDVVLEEVSRG